MRVIIEPVISGDDEAAMLRIQRQVFEREMGFTLESPDASCGRNNLRLIARVAPGYEAVGTVSVVDTSDCAGVHKDFRLDFHPNARVARFKHLAVLSPYRGRNIPLMMMLEAHRRFVAPQQFHHSWLLFNSRSALGSFLCRMLGFTVAAGTFVSCYGRRCPLVRDERDQISRQVIKKAEDHVKQLLNASVSFETTDGGFPQQRPETTFGGLPTLDFARPETSASHPAVHRPAFLTSVDAVTHS